MVGLSCCSRVHASVDSAPWVGGERQSHLDTGIELEHVPVDVTIGSVIESLYRLRSEMTQLSTSS